MLYLIFYLLTTHSHTFTLGSSNDSNMQGWQTDNLQIFVNGSACPFDITSNVMLAIDKWNSVDSSRIKLSYGGTTSSTQQGNPPVIRCDSNFSSSTGHSGNSYVGWTNFSLTVRRYIGAGEIILNSETGTSAHMSNLTDTQLGTLIAHEIGHLLGLGHSQFPYALMYHDVSQKPGPILSSDDAEGLTYLYPRDELNGDRPFGCARIAGPPRPPNGELIFILSLFAFLLLWQIRYLLPNRQPDRTRTSSDAAINKSMLTKITYCRSGSTIEFCDTK